MFLAIFRKMVILMFIYNTYLMEAGLSINSNPSGQSSHPRLWFVMEDTKERYLMDARIIDFSEFLRNILQDPPSLANDIQLQIELPSFLKVDTKMLQLITVFHSSHNFQKESIRVQKIKTSGWQKALDSTSKQFAQAQLLPLPEETARCFLGICEYLKLNLLKDVVCVFIASRHFHCYNDLKMQKDLEDMKIFYSRQMEINLKRSMLGYAKQLGVDMLEKVEAKHEIRRNNLRR